MQLGDPRHGWPGVVLAGLAYAVPVMTILLCHEMGHFLQAYRYGVYASLPYFIPMPLSPFGTFGAVIAMEPRAGGRRSPVRHRHQRPIGRLGADAHLPVVGLHLSHPALPKSGEHVFGAPLLFRFLAAHILGPMPNGYGTEMNPMAFAGWVGLFITSLNLIPIGQLDGGHVLYALLRKRAHKVASFLLFTAVFVVIWRWQHYWQWTVMLILLLLMGPIHPPTANDDQALRDRAHRSRLVDAGVHLRGFYTDAAAALAKRNLGPHYSPCGERRSSARTRSATAWNVVTTYRGVRSPPHPFPPLLGVRLDVRGHARHFQHDGQVFGRSCVFIDRGIGECPIVEHHALHVGAYFGHQKCGRVVGNSAAVVALVRLRHSALVERDRLPAAKDDSSPS